MKVTFLGSGAATAMPLPFCSCEVCREARILGGKNIRRRASLVINDDLLIDLGPDSVAACGEYGIDLTKISYLLQTHAHSDHFDTGHLITRHPEYMGTTDNVLSIVATGKTLIAMDRMLKDEDGSADLHSPDFLNDLRLGLIPANVGEELTLGGYKITALDSHHDKNQDAVVYYIEKDGKNILYGTDMLMADEQFYDFLAEKELDILILDQTYGEGVNSGGHLDAGMIYDIIKKLRDIGGISEKTKIYGTHISHEGNFTHDKMEAIAMEHGYHIAYDGLIIEV